MFLCLLLLCCEVPARLGVAGTFGGIRQSRLQQLVDWCGGQHFGGCLIFDECHKAKNFVPVSRNNCSVI